MKYITGYGAFAIPCKLDTPHIWNMSKENFDKCALIWESREMPFGDVGITMNVYYPIKLGEGLTNVADHERAFLDLLYLGKFDVLNGIINERFPTPQSRYDLMCKIYSAIKVGIFGDRVKDFMTEELGSYWKSFVNEMDLVSGGYRSNG